VAAAFFTVCFNVSDPADIESLQNAQKKIKKMLAKAKNCFILLIIITNKQPVNRLTPPPMKRNILFKFLPVSVAILCANLSGAQAASITNNDSGQTLTSAAAWVGGVAPGLNDIAVFDSTIAAGSPANATNLLGANTYWGGVRVANPAVPLQISAGSTLTNGAFGIDMGQATTSLTLNAPVFLGANQSWVVANGQTLNVNGVVSGTNLLTLNNGGTTNGTITINVANTYTGGTVINGGLIVVSNSAALGAAAGTITNLGGTIVLPASAGITISSPLNVSNTTVIDMNVLNANTSSDTFTLPLTGSGTIIVSNLEGPILTDTASIETLTFGAGAAGQTMSGFSGHVVFPTFNSLGALSGGNFRFNSGGSTINQGGTNISFNLGGGYVAFTVRGGGLINIGELTGGPYCSLYSSRSTAASDTIWSVGGLNTSTTYSGQIRNFTGTGATGSYSSLTKVGTGTLTLTGTNTYTGDTTLNGGFLNLGIAENGSYGPIGEPGVAGSLLFGGGTLQYSSVNQYDYSALFDNGTLGNQPISIDVNGQFVTFGTTIAGTGTSLTLTNSTGSGTLQLDATESYTGPTTINGGTLQLEGSALFTNAITSIGGGGTFDVSGVGGTYTLNGPLQAGGSGGATAATIIGASTVDLNIQPVSFTWNGTSSGGDSSHPSLTISSGTLHFNNNKITVVVPGAGLSPGVYTLATAPTITGSPNSIPSFAGGNGLSFGDSALVSVSGHTLILTVSLTSALSQWTDGSSDNMWATLGNWTAAVPQNPGDAALFFSTGGSNVVLNVSETVGGILFSNPSSDTISGPNTLTLNNNGNGAQFAVKAGNSNVISSGISLNDLLTINMVAGTSLALSGVVSNGPSLTETLTVVGSGTNILSNVNTYGPAAGTVGTTLINSILQVGNNSALGAGDVSVVANSTLQSGAAGLTIPNNITGQAGITVTANNNGNTFALGGVVGGSSANLVATGSGTNSLLATNTYGGTTTINAGSTLVIGGAGQLGSTGTNTQSIVDNGIFNYNSSAIQTLSGVVSGSGILKSGAGNLTLPVANTYTAGTVINGGIVQPQNGASFGTGAVTNNGGTILLLPAAALTFANNLWFTGTSFLDQSNYAGNDTFNGTFGGSGTVIVTNLVTVSSAAFSTLTLGGAMTNFSGSIVVASTNSQGIATAGFLRFDSGTTVINTGSSNASFNLGNGAITLTSRNPETGNLGALTGGPGTFVEGPRNNGTTIWSIGALNTSTTFAGTIENYDATEPTFVGLVFAGLTKVGTGTLTLSGQNTYTASTTISNGTLALITGLLGDASISDSTNIYINTNATLNISALGSPTLTLNPGYTIGGGGTLTGNLTASGGTLIAGNANSAATLTITGNLIESGATNYFALATTNGIASNDVVSVSGLLNVSSGTQVIYLSGFNGGAVTNGTYTLFNYGSLSGSTANFNVIQVGIYPYVSTLVNNSGLHQIQVVVTAPPRAATNLVWQGDGVNNYWDAVSGNDWLAGVTPLTFESGDSVLFSDSGNAHTNVSIQGQALYPSAFVVSNSIAGAYNLNGSGSVAGSIGLIKTNSGTLIINDNNNIYTGPTVFGGGTVYISYLPLGGMPSPIGAASNNSTNLVFNGGTLAYNGGITSGTDRGFTLTGSGGTIGVYNSSVLTVTGLVAGTSSLLVTGDGTSTLALAGASTNSGNIVISNATLSDVNVENNTLVALGGLGNPQIAGRTVTVDTNGILSFDASGGNELGGGSTTNALRLIINQGGLVQITSGNASIGPVTLNGGTLSPTTSAATGNQYGAFEFSGDLIVTGNVPSTISSGSGSITLNLTVDTFVPNRTFNVAHITGNTNPDLFVSAVLGNSGGSQAAAGLIKTGAGTMQLSAANIYTGNTYISNGVLQVTGSLGNSTTNSVIISGGTLAGSGIIGAAITNQYGGTLAPGAVTNVAGTVMTVENGLTMLNGSTNIMQVTHTPSQTSDQISTLGTVTYGGILLVATNAGDSTAYAAGQTFTLFSLGGPAQGSFNTIQPPPGPGLGWSGANLTVNGSISVVSSVILPTAGFSGSPTLGAAALPVTFVNSSSGGATYWNWTFGDGSTLGTNSSVNLVHTYTNAGTYTVVLQAYGTGGTSLLTNTAYIVVTNLPPVTSFVAGPTNGAAPLSVIFTNTTTGVATSYLYSFGDGTTFTTNTAGNVSHVYTNASTYDVGLTATGTGGVVLATNAVYITPTNLIPVAIFSGSPTNIFATQTVTFTNSSTGNGLTNWVWSFGDGSPLVTNLTGANIAHAYASTAGSPYTVGLSVYGPGGSGTTNRTGYIVVLAQPKIGSVALSTGKLILSGTGGPVGQQYRILGTNNVAAPLATWIPVYTNTFAAPSGSYSYTNSTPTNGASFYILVSP